MCVRVRDLQSGSNGPPSSSWREVVSLTWQERIRETWQFQSRERNVPFPALTVNTLTITLFLLLALSPSVCVFVGITLHYSIFPENTNDITPTPLSFVCRFFSFWTRLYRLHLSEGAQISPSSYPGTRLNSWTRWMWVQTNVCFSMCSVNL